MFCPSLFVKLYGETNWFLLDPRLTKNLIIEMKLQSVNSPTSLVQWSLPNIVLAVDINTASSTQDINKET